MAIDIQNFGSTERKSKGTRCSEQCISYHVKLISQQCSKPELITAGQIIRTVEQFDVLDYWIHFQ